MKTPKHTLSQLLFEFGFSALTLSAKAGMLLEHLEAMYLAGNPTDAELDHLASVMDKPRERIAPIFTAQAGNFNQNGVGNRQKTVLKAKNVHIHVHIHPAPAQPTPRTAPGSRKPKALELNLPQWQPRHLLPGGQAAQSLPTGTYDL